MRKENTCTVLIRLFLYFLMLILITSILVWGLVQSHLNGGLIFIAMILISRCVLLGIEKIVAIVLGKSEVAE